MDFLATNTSSILLFLFSFGAFFIPIIARKIRFPVIVGEVIFGYYIGKILLPDTPLNNLEFIDGISNMGFIFLMFLAGMEINFDRIKIKSLKRSLIIILLFYVIS